MNRAILDIKDIARHIDFLTCSPLSEVKTPPKEQEDTRIELCEGCRCKIWTSKKKRAIKKIKPSIQMLCFDCTEKHIKKDMEKRKSTAFIVGDFSNVDLVDIMPDHGTQQ